MTIDSEDLNEGLLSTHFAEKTLLGICNTPIAFPQNPDSSPLRIRRERVHRLSSNTFRKNPQYSCS